MTFFEFYEKMKDAKYLGWLVDQREGQFVMNELYQIRPDLYDAVMKNEECVGNGDTFRHRVDPFYADDNLPAFWDFLMENWES